MANLEMIDLVRPRLKYARIISEAFYNSLSHPVIKGRLREIIVSDIIKDFIPPNIEVVTGIIVSFRGERIEQNQDDIILFSKSVSPVLFKAGEQHILPIEGVKVHIEVKSKLTRADIKKSLQVAAELRNLKSPDEKTAICLIFAFDSDCKGSEAERLIEILKEPGMDTAGPGQNTYPVQGICVLNKGLSILVKHPITEKEGWHFIPADNENHLLGFISILSNTLYGDDTKKLGIGAYLLDENWFDEKKFIPFTVIKAA